MYNNYKLLRTLCVPGDYHHVMKSLTVRDVIR